MNRDGHALLAGVVVPVITAMDTHRTPDPGRMSLLLDALAAASITKIMLFGSNGEGPVLSQDQIGVFAASVARQWRERVPGGAVFINVSGVSTADSLRRARAVAVSEPDAVVVSPPMYFRHTAMDLRVHYEAFGVLETPVIAYNVPAYTGNDLTPRLVEDLARLDHVIGLKDSSKIEGRIPAAANLTPVQGSFGVSQGDENQLLRGLSEGAAGITPGVANLAPRVAVALYDAWRTGDTNTAQAAQERIRALITIHRIRPGIATTKAALELRGICPRAVSRPFADYRADDEERLREFLAHWDDDLISG